MTSECLRFKTLLLSFLFPQALYVEHDVIWCGTSPAASLGQPSWLCPLPASHAPGSMRSWKAFDCLATTKNISMLSTLFSSQIQNTALHQLPDLSHLIPGQLCKCQNAHFEISKENCWEKKFSQVLISVKEKDSFLSCEGAGNLHTSRKEWEVKYGIFQGSDNA